MHQYSYPMMFLSLSAFCCRNFRACIGFGTNVIHCLGVNAGAEVPKVRAAVFSRRAVMLCFCDSSLIVACSLLLRELGQELLTVYVPSTSLE